MTRGIQMFGPFSFPGKFVTVLLPKSIYVHRVGRIFLSRGKNYSLESCFLQKRDAFEQLLISLDSNATFAVIFILF